VEQYINKSALVAEIEKKYNKEEDWMNKQGYTDYHIGLREAYKDLRDLVDTLEVKEVDLEKELSTYLEVVKATDEDIDFVDFAKHFFELGLNASNPLTWEDMMLIHKCCKDAMNSNLYAWQTAEGQQKIYKDVLKRFKVQKGE
jgi:hypothetical protein